MLLLLLFGALLLCVVEMRRGWPPFIGGEEGVFEKCLLPSWKVQIDMLGTLNLAITL